MRVWIDGSVFDPAIRIFGLDLIERQLLGLLAIRKLKPPRAMPSKTVVDMGASGAADPTFSDEVRSVLSVEIVRGAGSFGERLSRFLAGSDEPVLVLSGESLIDARLLADLEARKGSWAALDEGGALRAAIVRLEPAQFASVPLDCQSLGELASRTLGTGVQQLTQKDFNGFIRKLRRTLPFYIHAVRDQVKVRELQRFLFWSNYKGSTDFFTKYVYPPLVWLMVRPLAAWRVHPNTVTIVSIIMTFAAIPFFATGYFLTGILLAYGMSVLDSVDGKLARLTFTDSKLGNILDHGLDLIHPPMWYFAWAWGLAGGDPDHLLVQLAVLSTIVYILDRVVLKVYPTYFQRGLHTHSKMDTFARTFISRRNINLPLFTAGVIADLILGGAKYATLAFYVVVAWQVATLLYHGGRTAWILFVEKAQNDPRRASAT